MSALRCFWPPPDSLWWWSRTLLTYYLERADNNQFRKVLSKLDIPDIEPTTRSESVHRNFLTLIVMVCTDNSTSSYHWQVLFRSSQGYIRIKMYSWDPLLRLSNYWLSWITIYLVDIALFQIGGREFQHQYTLMRHLPTHTDERNFHCNACGKSFRQLSTLSQHKAIHSAERPYSCEVYCNK